MKRNASVVFASAIGVAILVALGAWQVARLQWKNAIVAQIEARRTAPVTSLPPAPQWPSLKPDDYEYRHVALTGAFEPDKTVLVYRGGTPNAPGAGPGYLVLTPLRLPTDDVVIVNRGFVPLADASAARGTAPTGTVSVSGLMRSPETRNAFTPADDTAKGVWYTRDPASIAATSNLQRVAPFTIDVDADPKAQGWPRAGTTVIDIPNNHLSYALTWWGLALALIAVTVAFLRKSKPPAPSHAS